MRTGICGGWEWARARGGAWIAEGRAGGKEPYNLSNYTVLCDIYSTCTRFVDDLFVVESASIHPDVVLSNNKKTASTCTWIELNPCVYWIILGDRLTNNWRALMSMIAALAQSMRDLTIATPPPSHNHFCRTICRWVWNLWFARYDYQSRDDDDAMSFLSGEILCQFNRRMACQQSYDVCRSPVTTAC